MAHFGFASEPKQEPKTTWERQIGTSFVEFSITRETDVVRLYNCKCKRGDTETSAPTKVRTDGDELDQSQVEELFLDFVAKMTGQ